jgi:arsenate reductase
MSTEPLNVLFLCTGNSARSILGEAIMNRLGNGQVRASSAGSAPKGQVHPAALRLLEALGHPTEGLRSKSWEEFERPGAPQMDFVFTVCDNAANEPCPLWPGKPMTAHWGLPDPAAVDGNAAEVAAAFADTYRCLSQRIGVFLSLPRDKLDRLSMTRRLGEIGAGASEPAEA